MLRITDLKLPLDHPPEALEAAVRARLGLRGDEPLTVHVFRRGHDARTAGSRRNHTKITSAPSARETSVEIPAPVSPSAGIPRFP